MITANEIKEKYPLFWSDLYDYILNNQPYMTIEYKHPIDRLEYLLFSLQFGNYHWLLHYFDGYGLKLDINCGSCFTKCRLCIFSDGYLKDMIITAGYKDRLEATLAGIELAFDIREKQLSEVKE